ncbi:hypothetical protein NQ318_004478 [Aromia moschata]|uniref:Mitochondrial transcription rescue factor 1 C-terminal domain-containing protein n=1 Tax=Aromia moschata TaxID=1265417 RepID=A0AAV8XJS3_9CUCU|nr:hypothetical protein NQ318_004478 [Aromia moschata]
MKINKRNQNYEGGSSPVVPGNLQICRFKSKGDKSNQKSQVSDSETDKYSDDDFLENIQDKNARSLKVGSNLTASGAIIKAGLGLSRNKIELIFYESKIRLNGAKVLKKSTRISEGDEIDIIKGVNVNNPDFWTVARIEVISFAPKEESISVKLRRCKSLTVENYRGNDGGDLNKVFLCRV